VKAKQIECLIESLPVPESDEVMVRDRDTAGLSYTDPDQDGRLRELNDEMNVANEEYAQALDRASTSTAQLRVLSLSKAFAENLYRELTETMDILLADPAPPLNEETE
jgi:hypothetical protein